MKTIYDQPTMTRLSESIREKNESMMRSGIFPDLKYYGPEFLPVPEIFFKTIDKFDNGGTNK